MLKFEYLACDLNFVELPEQVSDFIFRHATNRTQFVSWIELMEDEVVQRTWGFRRLTHGTTQWMEVERKSPVFESAQRRNCYLTTYSGYHVVYEQKTHANGNWYGYTYYYFDATTDWKKWYREYEMGITTTILNPERIFELDKYKYCGYSGEGCLVNYLREYEKNPKVEYFGKMGLLYSKSLMKMCSKDKAFINWLRQQDPYDVNIYGPAATIKAYKEKISIEVARRLDAKHRDTVRRVHGWIPEIKGSDIDLEKLEEYCEYSSNRMRNYNDYFKAIKYLGYDLHDTKNIFPKDFDRMHELRTMEYAAAVEKEAEKARRALSKRIKKVAAEYSATLIETDKYLMLMPSCVRDFIHEGAALHHCVGRMGYDKKMADKKCLIGFIRTKEEPDKPFVTCEYSMANKKIAQCYADHDSRPQDDIIHFAEQWATVITEMIKEQTNGKKQCAN